MKLGFIGLGTMGTPMATNLLKAGHALRVFDIDRSRADALIALGAEWAKSPAEAAQGAEVVLTSLPGPAQVEEVIAGEGGVLEGIGAGAVWVDLTTNEIEVIRTLAGLMAEKGAETLDVPVTGGVLNAHVGKITVFAGGPEAAFETVRPVLDAMAAEVFHFGELGSGTVIKLVTNFVAFVNAVALGEGMIFATKYGIDTGHALEAIKSSYADSFVAQTDGGKIMSGDYASDFVMSLACKDIRLTLELAGKMGLELPATELSGRVFNEARECYGESVGCLQAIRLLEERNGVALSRLTAAAGLPGS